MVQGSSQISRELAEGAYIRELAAGARRGSSRREEGARRGSSQRELAEGAQLKPEGEEEGSIYHIILYYIISYYIILYDIIL